MHARHIVLAVLAVILTAVAAAGPAVAKQRGAINAKVLPAGTFVLTPLRAGALKHDSGQFNGNWQTAPGRKVIRNGQEVETYTNTWTLTGKRGRLTIRERIEWIVIGSDGNGDGKQDEVATGTWNVVRGTGAYARIAGGGGSSHAGLGASGTAALRASSLSRSALHETRSVGCQAPPRSKRLSDPRRSVRSRRGIPNEQGVAEWHLANRGLPREARDAPVHAARARQ
jgi:hypothetical protein